MQTAQEDRAGLAPDAELMASGKKTIKPVQHVEQPLSLWENLGYLPYGKVGAVVEEKAEISRKSSISCGNKQGAGVICTGIRLRTTVPIWNIFSASGVAEVYGSYDWRAV